MHKCSKHQGPQAQVIYMDLDHVINSIAVIGNMKLWSQVICWCYQHCCCNSKCFQNTVPISFWCLTKEVFLWFSWLLYTKNFSLLHNPTSSHTSPHNSLQLKSWYSALLGAWGSFSSPWGVEGVRGSGGLQHRPAGSHKPVRRATYPALKYPGTWGRTSPHLLFFRSRGGSAAGSLPRSPFWQGIGRALCYPAQRSSSCLGWLHQMPQMGRLSRTETESTIGKIHALSTVRGGFGCSVCGGRTQQSPLLLGNHHARVEAAPKLTPGGHQGVSQGERRRRPSTRRERIENMEDLPWVSCWRWSSALTPKSQGLVQPHSSAHSAGLLLPVMAVKGSLSSPFSFPFEL